MTPTPDEVAALLEELPAIRKFYRGCTLKAVEDDINRLADALESLSPSAGMVMKDTERLNWLDMLNGRRYCGPNGQVWSLPTDIHIDKTFRIYVRDQRGSITYGGSGDTMREAIDAALSARERKEY